MVLVRELMVQVLMSDNIYQLNSIITLWKKEIKEKILVKVLHLSVISLLKEAKNDKIITLPYQEEFL